MRSARGILIVFIAAGLFGRYSIAAEGSTSTSETKDSSASSSAPSSPAAAAVPTERVEVTATRLPESTDVLPGFLTVVTGDELMQRGARDLQSALALVGGVGIAPGGDGGPASSVPEFLGLREFDAFLLTVDGVPWGGAFIPALATLDLRDVERIEVLRGAAPVMYGATSFVGVINVIRRSAGTGSLAATASGGSYGSGLIGADAPLPAAGSLRSSINAELSTQGFADDRAQVDRGILRWLGNQGVGKGTFRYNVSGIWQDQDPASPRPREGESLSPLVPVDSNHNPLGSHLDENRYVLGGTYEHPIRSGNWSATVSASRSNQDVLRGFLTDLAAPADNANGFRQDITMTEIYFDGHVGLTPRKNLRFIIGLDHLHGAGSMDGGDFDYTVGLNGSNPPHGDDIPNAGEFHVTDHREFSGLYGQTFWDPAARWHLELGLRLNRTTEWRHAEEVELSTGIGSSGNDDRSDLRGAGMAGFTFTAWQRDQNALRLFADYRNTYKPAVIDFGPEAEPEILEPETGESYEAGFKGLFAGGRTEVVVSAFSMNLQNIVVSQNVGGTPTLENAGEEKLRGVDMETRFRVLPNLNWLVGYGYHDARFGDYVTEFGGVPTQLEGNRIEMSARHLASTGLTYGSASGWLGHVSANYVGSRFLNKRNTALAPDYMTWDAGIAYRFQEYEVRLDGWNLNDTRPPVAESELGDAQYYLLSPRRIEIALRWLPTPKSGSAATATP
jgi:outer membrane receptor protein involved in Fe transport